MNNINIIECEFGCGEMANYQFKNGKWCCSTNVFGCPAIKQKIKKTCPSRNKGKVPWNKGKSMSDETKEKLRKTNKGRNFCASLTQEEEIERRKKISINGKGKLGGYRKGSGRGKKGWYKGYWCDSSYELAFIIYNLEHNIVFRRNTKKFTYIYKGQTKKYLPDFIMNDGTYIEIKGYYTDIVKEKINQFPHKIKVMLYDDLKYMIDYVIDKYGINYISLYENINYTSNCLICGKVIKNNKTGLCFNCIKNKTKKGKSKKNKTIKINSKNKYYCSECNKNLKQKTKTGMCSECYHKSIRKVNRPSYQQLLQDKEIMSMVKIGKKYGVSDNTIRKWLKFYKKKD